MPTPAAVGPRPTGVPPAEIRQWELRRKDAFRRAVQRKRDALRLKLEQEWQFRLVYYRCRFRRERESLEPFQEQLVRKFKAQWYPEEVDPTATPAETPLWAPGPGERRAGNEPDYHWLRRQYGRHFEGLDPEWDGHERPYRDEVQPLIINITDVSEESSEFDIDDVEFDALAEE